MLVGGGPLCSIPLYAVLSRCWCHGNQRADMTAWEHDAGGLNKERRCRTGSGIAKWCHAHPSKRLGTLHIISQRTNYLKISGADSLPSHRHIPRWTTEGQTWCIMKRSAQQQSIQLLELQWLRAAVGRHCIWQVQVLEDFFGRLPDFRRFKMKYS